MKNLKIISAALAAMMTVSALGLTALADELDEQEADIYRRGRNAKSYTSAKNASIGDYRKATGFEALMGYLYLTGREDRMLSLIKKFSLC